MAKAKSTKKGSSKDKVKKGDPKVVAKKAAEKPKKPERVKGPKPDFTPKMEANESRREWFHITQVRRLVNGIADKEKYLIGDAEFEKSYGPIYKDAPESEWRTHVVFMGAPEGHELILSGVQPGMMMLTNKLVNHVFAPSKGAKKDKKLHAAQYAFWKFIRDQVNGTGKRAETKVSTPKSQPASASDLKQLIAVGVGGNTSFAEKIASAVHKAKAGQFNPELVWENEGGLAREVVEAVEAKPAPVAEAKKEDPRPVVYPTDPRLIWDGMKGIVEVRGVKFLVVDKMEKAEHVNAVSVYEAPQGSLLFGFGINTRITIRQLRCFDEFPLKGEGKKKEEKIWNFLREIFTEAGLIKKPAVNAENKEMPKKTAKPEMKPVEVKPAITPLETLAMLGSMVDAVAHREELYKGSTDIGKLFSGLPGEYVVGNVGARVMVKVSSRPGNFIEVRLIRSEEGSTLNGKCKDGITIAHKWLTKPSNEVIVGNGNNAEYKSVLYTFLAGVISRFSEEHHKATGIIGQNGRLTTPQYGRSSADVHQAHPTPQ